MLHSLRRFQYMAKRKVLKKLPNQGVSLTLDYDRVVVHEHELPTKEARLAVDLVRHLAICSCVPLNEFDKAGRVMHRLMTPAEVADRACGIATCLLSKFRDLNWIVDLPVEEELTAIEAEEAAYEKRVKEREEKGE